MPKTESPLKKESPYVFKAGARPARELAPGVMGHEAKMLGGMTLRYQERKPGPQAAGWCETGHSVFMLGGRLRYEFPIMPSSLAPATWPTSRRDTSIATAPRRWARNPPATT